MFDDELASVRAQPPRTGLLPGMRVRGALPKSTLALLVVFIGMFTFIPLSIIGSDPMMKLRIGPGTEVKAHVLSVSPVSACGRTDSRRIVYAFSSASGGEFRGMATVCQRSPYYSVQAGDDIEIRYLTRDPSLNAIAGANAGNAMPLLPFAFFPVFILILFASFIFPQAREAMRARRLYNTGLLVRGKVVFVKKQNTQNSRGLPGGTMADVYVAWDMPNGTRQEAVAWCSNDWLLYQLSPGTDVHMLLPADGSARGALLEAYVR